MPEQISKEKVSKLPESFPIEKDVTLTGTEITLPNNQVVNWLTEDILDDSMKIQEDEENFDQPSSSEGQAIQVITPKEHSEIYIRARTAESERGDLVETYKLYRMSETEFQAVMNAWDDRLVEANNSNTETPSWRKHDTFGEVILREFGHKPRP